MRANSKDHTNRGATRQPCAVCGLTAYNPASQAGRAPAWLRLARFRQNSKVATLRQDGVCLRMAADRVCRLIDSLPTGHALAIAAALLAAGDAAAQPAEPFFARKTVTITIG